MENQIRKMIKIVRADTCASEVYRDMLLSMLPNSTNQVNISEWNYKADRDDFDFMLNLMRQSHTDMIFEYENKLQKYIAELKKDAVL